jgi:hypothetical protein
LHFDTDPRAPLDLVSIRVDSGMGFGLRVIDPG